MQTTIVTRRDWRLRASVGITIAWLALGLLYIQGVPGWSEFVRQRAPDLGGFLEGAFAPLAFLWLVVGFFLQQQQLEDNTRTIQRQLEVMERQAEQAEVQARAIAADEMHSRQDVFMRTAAMVDQQLGLITATLVTFWTTGTDRAETSVGLWEQMGSGDYTVFDRRIIFLFHSEQVTPRELFWRTEIRSEQTRRFILAFERLLSVAERCDPDGLIADALRAGLHGTTSLAVPPRMSALASLDLRLDPTGRCTPIEAGCWQESRGILRSSLL